MAIPTMSNTLVLGIGNELLSDDSIGLIVVRYAQEQLGKTFSRVVFKNNYSAGFDLLYDIMDVTHAVIVDAVCTGQKPPGFCHEFSLDHIQHMTQIRLADSHGLNLSTIVALGEKMGYAMPGDIKIFGIETCDFTSFSTRPTSAVESAIPYVLEMIRTTLIQWES